MFKFSEISYTEILSWATLTGTPLNAWEVETMLHIKLLYDSTKQKATKKDMPAPYATEERVHQNVDDQFAALWSKAE